MFTPDIRKTAANAHNLGGRMLHPPVELGVDTVIAPIRDRLGGQMSLWQSEALPRAGHLQTVGAWSHAALITPAVKTARSFYGELFNWEFSHHAGYEEIKHGGPLTASIRPN
ncbi:MAG: hypothetical protein GEU78_18060, partial [Actinobacteria bacterium]|nr:hypothetical protein [Actinomycetota bacterium]